VTVRKQIQDALESVRQRNVNPYVERGLFDDLLNVLAIAFCQHEFQTRRRGGAPDDAFSNERVTVCKHCGVEPDDDQ
jgi:hypothetical protein